MPDTSTQRYRIIVTDVDDGEQAAPKTPRRRTLTTSWAKMKK